MVARLLMPCCAMCQAALLQPAIGRCSSGTPAQLLAPSHHTVYPLFLYPPSSLAGFTYEHIPAAIAHDLRSAPRSLSLLAYIGKPPAPPTAQAQPTASGDGGAASADCAGCGTAGAAGEGGHAGAPSDAQPTAAPSQPAAVPAALAAGGTLLGQWRYDVHSAHAVQTFPVDSTALPAGRAIDHVRLVVSSNWGHPGFTCLYRLRMHGAPAVAVPAAAAA